MCATGRICCDFTLKNFDLCQHYVSICLIRFIVFLFRRCYQHTYLHFSCASTHSNLVPSSTKSTDLLQLLFSLTILCKIPGPLYFTFRRWPTSQTPSWADHSREAIETPNLEPPSTDGTRTIALQWEIWH